jgi:hypothetical protein
VATPGAAGEHAVASELSRRRWAATLTYKGSPEIDVLAWDGETRRTAAIQVKTASPGRKPFQTEHEAITTSIGRRRGVLD